MRADLQLNAMEDKIMEIGSRLIITQQPVAKDLRRIIVAFKISSDLERMGDLALDVAKATMRLQGQTLIKPLVDIPRMAEIVTIMIDEQESSPIWMRTLIWLIKWHRMMIRSINCMVR